MVDKATFTEEATALLGTLYRISASILHSEADAQDAVQQGLLRAWSARGRAQPERLRPWLTKIIINECRNIQRHRMRVTPVMDMPGRAEYAPHDPDVATALNSLPEKWRVPLLLMYAGRYTEREIAKALGIPVTTVKSRLHSARKALRGRLEDKEVVFE